MVARQLGSHTTGYVTWKGGSGSSMETSVVTEYDNSRLQLGLQVDMYVGVHRNRYCKIRPEPELAGTDEKFRPEPELTL